MGLSFRARLCLLAAIALAPFLLAGLLAVWPMHWPLIAALAPGATSVLIYLVGDILLVGPYRTLSATTSRFQAAFLGNVVLSDRPTRPDENAEERFTSIMELVTEHDLTLREANSELANLEAEFRTLAETSTDLVVRGELPSLVRTYVSPSCRQLYGYDPEELVGATAQEIVHPDDWPMLDLKLNAPLRSGAGTVRVSYRVIRKDGSTIWVETSATTLPGQSNFVALTRDITERKIFEASLEKANAKLELIASQDALTGLANRRRFDDAFATEWRRARREGTALTLLMIDADRFKSYNDTLGHPAGDGCLRAIAGAIAGVVRRPGDLVARYGGEEMAVILPSTNEDGAQEMAERLRQAVETLRIPHPGSEFGIVTISVGGASIRPGLDEDSAHVLLAQADRALYLAKTGRNAAKIIRACEAAAEPPAKAEAAD